MVLLGYQLNVIRVLRLQYLHCYKFHTYVIQNLFIKCVLYFMVCFHLGSDNLLQLEIKKWKDLHEQDLEKIENMKQEYNCMAKEVCSKFLANIY